MPTGRLNFNIRCYKCGEIIILPGAQQKWCEKCKKIIRTKQQKILWHKAMQNEEWRKRRNDMRLHQPWNLKRKLNNLKSVQQKYYSKYSNIKIKIRQIESELKIRISELKKLHRKRKLNP